MTTTTPAGIRQAIAATTTPAETRRQVVRQFLHDRYNGVIPVTDEMVQSVMDGLAEGQPELTADDEYLYRREQED